MLVNGITPLRLAHPHLPELPLGPAFDPVTHRYTHDGAELESVTSVLARAGQIPDFATPADMERGTEVHRITACHDRNEIEPIPEELRGYVAAWRKWTAESGFYAYAIEEPVFDVSHRLAGTPDRVGTLPVFGARRVVVDLKTTAASAVPAWARYQLAAYAMMLRRTPGDRLERVAVAVTPRGRYAVKVFSVGDLLADWRQFLDWRGAT